MGKSSSQVVGYRYSAKFAAFIGNRIEKFLGINFDNRGWILHDPTKHPPNLLPVQKPNLYGETEGGVSGNIDIHFGTPDQEPNLEYQKYFPLVSGYPYQSYLVFRGEGGPDFSGVGGIYEEVANILGADGRSSFYVGNSGYMKEMLLWVKRTRVRNDGQGQWYEVRGDGAVVCEIGARVNESTITHLTNVRTNARQRYKLTGVVDSETIMPVLINQLRLEVGDIFHSGSVPGFYSTYGVQSKNLNYLSEVIIEDNFEAGKCFAIRGEYVTTSKESLVIFGNVLRKTITPISYPDIWLKHVSFYQYEILFETTGSGVIGIQVNSSEFVRVGSAVNSDPDAEELPDEYLRYRCYAHIARFEFSPEEYTSTQEISELDINPIHKIREILTDDTAMNKPESDVNDINFMKAADRIWDEGLGVSWAIDEKSCIDAIEELCYHIEAGIRVNRQTGSYEMVLFRDDWFSEDEIHTIAENKIKDLSLEVMNSDDIVNQLNVTYYDRQRIKNSTFSIYENGSILTMGHANAESIEFPYFMNMRNAEIVANWKLKQYSTPAWKGTFTTGWREARKWNRYDLVKINWSKKWQGTILARIMKIDLGNGLNNEVVIDFEEVVPYSGEMNTSIVVDAPVELAPQPPQPSMNAVFEAPYYLTVLRAGQTNADLELSNNPDIGYVAAIAAKPQSNSLNALLYTDGGISEFEQVSRLDYCDILQLDQPINETASAFVVTGSLTQTANSNNFILLNDELMGFVSFNSETKVLTVKRGVLDTIPKKHNSGNLFVFDLPDVAFDSTQYSQSEIVEAQVLTTTPSGIQELSTGTAIEIQSRAIRPYPPANVKINDAYYPETIIVTNDIVLTWVDRNRLQQTGGAPLGFFDEGVTVEQGVNYSYELASDGVVLDSDSSITINTATILASVLIPNKPHTLKLWSSRDGYDSYQVFEHAFFVESASLTLTATTDGFGVVGNTVPIANITADVDTSLKANMQFDGSAISGKAEAGATITIEIQE